MARLRAGYGPSAIRVRSAETVPYEPNIFLSATTDSNPAHCYLALVSVWGGSGA